MKDAWSNIKFYGRCIKIVFREWWHRLFPVVAICICCGCANINVRTSKPYACAPHPYYCTERTWSCCVCAPFQLGSSNDPIWTSFATLTWPFWLVDEVAEVALDTVFLPVDGIYALCRDKPKQPQDEAEKIEEVR